MDYCKQSQIRGAVVTNWQGLLPTATIWQKWNIFTERFLPMKAISGFEQTVCFDFYVCIYSARYSGLLLSGTTQTPTGYSAQQWLSQPSPRSSAAHNRWSTETYALMSDIVWCVDDEQPFCCKKRVKNGDVYEWLVMWHVSKRAQKCFPPFRPVLAVTVDRYPNTDHEGSLTFQNKTSFRPYFVSIRVWMIILKYRQIIFNWRK